jgi:hypothetical protein
LSGLLGSNAKSLARTEILPVYRCGSTISIAGSGGSSTASTQLKRRRHES